MIKSFAHMCIFFAYAGPFEGEISEIRHVMFGVFVLFELFFLYVILCEENIPSKKMPKKKLTFHASALFPLIVCLCLCACSNRSKVRKYSLDTARYHMQHSNWDSAKIYAVHVLGEAESPKEISLARTIIELAKENILLDKLEEGSTPTQIPTYLRSFINKKEGITWLYDKMTTPFPNKNSMHLYIGEREHERWIRLKVQYHGKEPLDFHGFTVETVEHVFTFSSLQKRETGASKGEVWERVDVKYTQKVHMMIESILKNEVALLIMHGKDRDKQRFLSIQEKEAFRHILATFEVESKPDMFFAVKPL